jgi:uncharacterized BrkB/YihY/UPF0761 family membrane protein
MSLPPIPPFDAPDREPLNGDERDTGSGLPAHPDARRSDGGPDLINAEPARSMARLCFLLLICLMPSLFSVLDTVISSATRTPWIPDSASDIVLWSVLGWLLLLSIPASLVLIRPATNTMPPAGRAMMQVAAAAACVYLNAQIAFGAYFLLA